MWLSPDQAQDSCWVRLCVFGKKVLCCCNVTLTHRFSFYYYQTLFVLVSSRMGPVCLCWDCVYKHCLLMCWLCIYYYVLKYGNILSRQYTMEHNHGCSTSSDKMFDLRIYFIFSGYRIIPVGMLIKTTKSKRLFSTASHKNSG